MKKSFLIPVLLSLLLLFSGCSSTKLDLAAVPLARTDALDTAAEGAVLAVGCSVNGPLSALELNLQITGESPSVTVEIYEAEKDYETTVAKKPVRKETLTNLTNKVLYQFQTLDAGDYLLVFSEAKNAALMKSVVPSDAANQKILSLRNGQPMNDGTCAVTLMLVKTQANPEPTLTTFQYPIPQQ